MDQNSQQIAAEIVVPAGPRAPVRSVPSAGAHYQQCVQLMSDSNDTLDAIVAAQRSWIAALIDAQKTALDLCDQLFRNDAGTSFVRGMLEEGAKNVLFNGQID